MCVYLLWHFNPLKNTFVFYDYCLYVSMILSGSILYSAAFTEYIFSLRGGTNIYTAKKHKVDRSHIAGFRHTINFVVFGIL